MTTDPSLLDAFRKQCRFTGEPWTVFLAWKMSGEDVDQDDLIDIAKEVAEELQT